MAFQQPRPPLGTSPFHIMEDNGDKCSLCGMTAHTIVGEDIVFCPVICAANEASSIAWHKSIERRARPKRRLLSWRWPTEKQRLRFYVRLGYTSTSFFAAVLCSGVAHDGFDAHGWLVPSERPFFWATIMLWMVASTIDGLTAERRK